METNHWNSWFKRSSIVPCAQAINRIVFNEKNETTPEVKVKVYIKQYRGNICIGNHIPLLLPLLLVLFTCILRINRSVKRVMYAIYINLYVCIYRFRIFYFGTE